MTVTMQLISDFDVPPVLRSNIERHSEKLMGLVATLLSAAVDEQQVRSRVDHACSSFRDDLTATILALRVRHES